MNKENIIKFPIQYSIQYCPSCFRPMECDETDNSIWRCNSIHLNGKAVEVKIEKSKL